MFAKGFPYSLDELIGDRALVDRYRDGSYVTLRLTSTMYHRFHAPADCRVDEVIYISGDTWNVNPATLSRVGRVYCRNTRAVIPIHVAAASTRVTLVPVGAVLVSSIHLDFLTAPRLRRRDASPAGCRSPGGSSSAASSTARPSWCWRRQGWCGAHHVTEGASMRVGQMLWRRPTLRA